MAESKKFSSLPITDFRNRIGDLARPNLFHIEMGFPDIATKNPFIGGEPGSVADVEQALAGNKGNNGQSNAVTAGLTTVLAKAANIPASTVGVIDVPYRGRVLKIAGDRTFEPWTVTVLNDAGFALRSKFEAWSTNIQALQQNLQNTANPGGYCADALVRQFDRQGNPVRSYKFAQIWPSNVSAIDLAWDSNDTPEEYTVEFQVQYWTYANEENMGHEKPIDLLGGLIT